MKTFAFALALVALAGCASSSEETSTGSSNLDQNLHLPDLIFGGTGIINPSFLFARDACEPLGIAKGERLSLVAEDGLFAIDRFQGAPALSIRVPAEGQYVWRDAGAVRSTDEIVSEKLGLDIVDDSRTDNIVVHTKDTTCTIIRCPAFGPCQ